MTTDPPVSMPPRKWTNPFAGIWRRPLTAAALAVVLAVSVAVILAPFWHRTRRWHRTCSTRAAVRRPVTRWAPTASAATC